MSKKKEVIFTSTRGRKYEGEWKDGENGTEHTMTKTEKSLESLKMDGWSSNQSS